MKRFSLILGVLAGCYSPTYAPGSPCTLEVGCPGDLVCDPAQPGGPTCVLPGSVGQPDAPVDATDATDAPVDAPIIDAPIDDAIDAMFDANPDIDGDGDPNELDNCPEVPNPNQGDEDQDNLGNECDPCPHLPAVQQDTDGDGIGNDCDPGPEQHTILAFETFDTDVPATWIKIPEDGWVFDADEATAVATGNSAAYLMVDVPLDRNITISTRFTIDAMNNTTAVGRSFGILNRSNASTDRGNSCTLTSRLPPPQNHLFILALDTNQSVTNDEVDPLEVGQSYTVVATELDGNQLDCGSSGMTGQHDLMAVQQDQGEYVGLRVRAGTASFEYILIIAGPVE